PSRGREASASRLSRSHRVISPRSVCSALLLAFAAMGFAVPKVLVVQLQHPLVKDADPNLPLANVLAQQIDDDGKLNSIVWSMTDPTFREAALGGKMRHLSDHPKPADTIDVANQLGAEYLLVCDAEKKLKNVLANTKLYHNGREVWQDKETMAVDV